jgi:multidrug efflux pump subunit AcrA (membrane-fusion protein)
MRALQRIAEARIEDAIERGEFEDLPGRGRPLDLEPMRGVPPELRAAYRLLRGAGVAPEEVRLRGALDEARRAARAATDTVAAEALRRRVAELELELALARKRRLA